MKIIQLMPEFDLAGAEIGTENLTYALTARGHDVTVVSMYTKHTPITDRLEAKGIEVVYLDKKSGFDLSMIPKMRSVFKRIKPDVIHTHRYLARYATPAAILSGVKHHVHTIHNMASKEVGSTDRKLNSFFYKRLGMYPVSISPVIKETVIEEYGLPAENIGMVYNGIDLSNCIPKMDYSFGEEINLLHVGRFNYQKNHEGILRAFAKVTERFPNARLNLYGAGELEQRCRELCHELSLDDHVNFCGTTDKIYSVMSKSDMFLLCSNYEGMPITLIETMATGLPIVATPVGGVVDMIEHEKHGLLCECNDDAIADAVIRMLSDRELRGSCGRAAKERSVFFSADNMAEGYIEIYNKLLKK